MGYYEKVSKTITLVTGGIKTETLLVVAKLKIGV